MPQTLLEEAIASHEPDQTGPEFLKWLYERLINVYKENPNIDFVQCLKRRADKAEAVVGRYLSNAEQAKINEHSVRIQAFKKCLEIVRGKRDIGSVALFEDRIEALIALEELNLKIKEAEDAKN